MKEQSTKGKAAKKVAPNKEVQIIAFDQFSITKEALAASIADYSNLVVTRENLKDAKKALSIVKEQRYTVQNQQKANDDKRITWYKSQMAQNKERADELIAIISPVEDPLAEKIKAIEDEIQAEKDAITAEKKRIYDGRVQSILNTGAVICDGGYELGTSLFISFEEIDKLNDSIFDKSLKQFTDLGAKIKEEKDKLEKIAERTKLRYATLFQKGMVRSQHGFVFPFEITTEVNASDDVIETLNDHDFDILVVKVDELICEKKEADIEKKRIDDEAKAEQDKKNKELQDKEDRLAEERQKFENEKKAAHEEMIKTREAQLFNLGMKKGANHFTLQGSDDGVDQEISTIPEYTEMAWVDRLKVLTRTIGDIKAHEDKLREEKRLEALEGERVKQLITLGFYEHEGCMTLPDYQTIPRSKIRTEERGDWELYLKLATQFVETRKEEKRKELLPEADRIADFISKVKEIPLPKLESKEGASCMKRIQDSIDQMENALEVFRQKL